MDEGDRFYADPKGWLRENMEAVGKDMGSMGSMGGGAEGGLEGGKREWPQYVVFFGQLEPVVREVLGGTGYGECWRRFNSQWHDDWRRKGDVVVWCVDGGGKGEGYEEVERRDGLAWLSNLVGEKKEDDEGGRDEL